MPQITFALICERKNPPDRRVVFSPTLLRSAQERFPTATFVVESSPIRVFPDVAYEQAEFTVTGDIAEADVMLGVKEVPGNELIPNKKYFFFSHTIKKQPYNRQLLLDVLAKNIELYDHEVLTGADNSRLIGFGRYAGLVGAYNGLRAWGLRFKTFDLPKAETLSGLEEMKGKLSMVKLPHIKIGLSGSGRVAKGAQEILDHLMIEQVGIDHYLTRGFEEPVYCMVDVPDYVTPPEGTPFELARFFENPTEYRSNFMRFAKTTDLFIAGHFYGDGAPAFITREEAKDPGFCIKIIADISCDIDGPIASTIRPSTIADPLYGYDPQTGTEVPFDQEGCITVMAVDNLPCELPLDASEGFGEMFLEKVLPAFFDDDKDGVLDRARMTQNGKLTARFSYLQEYVDGNE